MKINFKNSLFVGSVAAVSLSVGHVALASDYVPPTGEQPVYGQRYTPGLSDVKTVFELNAARLINKEIGFEFEMRSSESINFGADVVYTSKSEESGSSKGETQGSLRCSQVTSVSHAVSQRHFCGRQAVFGAGYDNDHRR